ncbi:hypothetical protein KP509_08G062900 [Ceratopteris richardii]|uniref:Pentatricopeptide repeat-containing protein n=1 Tax=Ceratopteris richardii TaxID=49495 RepID=A0A8T2U7B8_CERRI|nr:hypothetical protein KP509_08G062900 [Ceratopteris richardii]
MKSQVRKLYLSRLSHTKSYASTRTLRALSTSSSSSPGQAVAHILEIEFGSNVHSHYTPLLCSENRDERVSQSGISSLQEGIPASSVKHEQTLHKVNHHEGKLLQRPRIERLGPKYENSHSSRAQYENENLFDGYPQQDSREADKKHGEALEPHCQGCENPGSKNSTANPGDPVRFKGPLLHTSSSENPCSTRESCGASYSVCYKQYSPGFKESSFWPKTSDEVIKLLIDRVCTSRWTALNKDIHHFKIKITSKEVACVLNVLKDPLKARELFTWAAQRPDYVHDATCYAIMIDSLGGSIDHCFLDDLLAEMGKKNIEMSISTIDKLIGIYTASSNIEKAEQYFLKAQQLGMEVTPFTYKCMLQAFTKAGKCNKALELYRIMQKERQPMDALCYNILLDGLSKNGQGELVPSIFQEMKKHGNLADVYTYTILAYAYGHSGKPESALGLLEEMVQNGVTPNKATYNAVLDALARAKDKLHAAMKVYKQMIQSGNFPDVATAHIITKILCKARSVDQTRKFVFCIEDEAIRKEMCEHFIKALGKMGYVKEVCALFEIIKASKSQPSLATYFNMILTLCHGKEPNEALIMLRNVEEKAVSGSIPLMIYNNVLAALRNNNQFQAAHDLFRQMQERGPSPDVVSYNTIIAGLIKMQQLAYAERLFEEMDKFGCTPNLITFNSLLHSFARIGDVCSVRRLLQLMHAKEVTPDVITYNCAIECFGKAGKLKVARKVFKEMEEKGVSPSFVTYNNMLLALANAGHTEEALSLFEQMKAQGFIPDAMTFSILGHVYDKDPHLDKKWLVEEIRKAGLTYEQVT